MLLIPWLSHFRKHLSGRWIRRNSRCRNLQRGFERNCLETIGCVDVLERRTLLTAISWDGGAGPLNWNDAANWSGDVRPDVADTVTIGAAFSGVTIVSTANVTVTSITSEAALRHRVADQIRFVAGERRRFRTGDEQRRRREESPVDH